jgi:hypothetical protein
VINHKEKLMEVFEREAKLDEKRKKLDMKMDKLFQQKADIAFEFYLEFLDSNKECNGNSEYFKIYIENGYLVAEELIFIKKYHSYLEFKHRSIHRQDRRTSVYFDVKRSAYASNAVVIDKNQYDKIAKEFIIKVRE